MVKMETYPTVVVLGETCQDRRSGDAHTADVRVKAIKQCRIAAVWLPAKVFQAHIYRESGTRSMSLRDGDLDRGHCFCYERLLKCRVPA